MLLANGTAGPAMSLLEHASNEQALSCLVNVCRSSL